MENKRLLRHGSSSVVSESSSNDEVLQPALQVSERSRMFSVFLLAMLNLLTMWDRFATSGVLMGIQSFYSLGDASGGLLHSTYIVVFVATLVVLFFIGDAYNRKHLLVVFLSIWLLAVIASSFVPRDMPLAFFVIRASTAIGGAAMKAMVPVICAEFFQGKARAYAVMCYYISTSLGSGLATFTSSVIVNNGIAWQWALRLAPLLGTIFWLLMICYMEEPYRPPKSNEQGYVSSYVQELSDIIQCKTFIFITVAFLFIDFTMRAYQFWEPTVKLAVMEALHNDPKVFFGIDYATLMSSESIIHIFFVAGGTFISVFAAERLRDGFLCFSPTVRAPLLYAGISCLIKQPFSYYALYLLDHNIILSLGFQMLGQFFGLSISTVVMESILNTCPPSRHTAMNALFNLLCNVIADAPAPLLLGMLSDSLRLSEDDPMTRFLGLRNALYITQSAAIMGGFLLAFASIFYPADLQRVSGNTEEDQEDASTAIVEDRGYGSFDRMARTLTMSSIGE